MYKPDHKAETAHGTSPTYRNGPGQCIMRAPNYSDPSVRVTFGPSLSIDKSEPSATDTGSFPCSEPETQPVIRGHRAHFVRVQGP